MADLSHLETDDTLENEGVEAELPNLPGAKVRLIGVGARIFDEAQIEVARAMRLEDVPADQRDTEGRIRLAARLTTGWSGITDKGQPFEYSAENALALYRRLPRVRAEALRFVSNPGNYRGAPYDLETDEDATGN